ncbi:hypothetical protein C8R46DRAFT_1030617 [Mycena filopes]|nr:hypothetical protein C8R46DRAFT_1030617 [Mycena filopes]
MRAKVQARKIKDFAAVNPRDELAAYLGNDSALISHHQQPAQNFDIPGGISARERGERLPYDGRPDNESNTPWLDPEIPSTVRTSVFEITTDISVHRLEYLVVDLRNPKYNIVNTQARQVLHARRPDKEQGEIVPMLTLWMAMPLPVPSTFARIKESYRQCIRASGAVGATVAKVDNAMVHLHMHPLTFSLASSTQILLGGRFCKAGTRLNKPTDEKYIQRFVTTPDGHTLILICLAALMRLLDDTGVTRLGTDTTFKRVVGNEWEVVIFLKALKRAVTIARGYIDGATTEFYTLLIDELQAVKLELTGKSIALKRLVEGGNIIAGPRRAVLDFKSLVSEDDYARLIDLRPSTPPRSSTISRSLWKENPGLVESQSDERLDSPVPRQVSVPDERRGLGQHPVDDSDFGIYGVPPQSASDFGDYSQFDGKATLIFRPPAPNRCLSTRITAPLASPAGCRRVTTDPDSRAERGATLESGNNYTLLPLFKTPKSTVVYERSAEPSGYLLLPRPASSRHYTLYSSTRGSCAELALHAALPRPRTLSTDADTSMASDTGSITMVRFAWCPVESLGESGSRPRST